MRLRTVLAAVCLSSATLVSGVGPSVAATQDTSADKTWVQYLAYRDSRSTVRIGAWQALLSSAPDAAIAQFVASGYDYAVKLAAETKARNADFARRILDTYPAQYAPEVHAAAQYAVNSRDDADRERFAHGGFQAAEQRDRQVRQARGDQAKALLDADRAFVRDLAVNDPGAQVRVSASYATRVGATDDDLVDFFASGWALGARLDLEAYRLQAADNEAKWRASLARLVTDAQAAEQAAKDASGDAAAKARETAAQAWHAVGDQTAPARSAWDQAQEFADRQALNWAAIAQAAAAATGPNWAAVVAPAQDNSTQWSDERTFAADQARYWNTLLQQALDGEQRVRTGS